MSGKFAEKSKLTLNFSGSCQHCGNATLIHILERNIQTCAFCHEPHVEIAAQQTEENKLEPSQVPYPTANAKPALEEEAISRV